MLPPNTKQLPYQTLGEEHRLAHIGRCTPGQLALDAFQGHSLALLDGRDHLGIGRAFEDIDRRLDALRGQEGTPSLIVEELGIETPDPGIRAGVTRRVKASRHQG